MRIVATQPAESGIGEDFYQNILCVAWKRVADAFKALMAEGKLRRADPWLAAMHFKGLMLQDLLERQLLNAAKHDGSQGSGSSRETRRSTPFSGSTAMRSRSRERREASSTSLRARARARVIHD